MQFSAQTRRMVCMLFGASILVAAIIEPKLILYPLSLLTVVAAFVIFHIYNSYHLAVQRTIDDTYRIPGTEIVLRTKFADWSLGGAPYLEVTVGQNVPLKYCLAGPRLTRAQLYAVEGGRILLETARDTFLINTTPYSVDGPRSWMRGNVKVNQYGNCDYDARTDASDQERTALKSGLIFMYLGAFDADRGYRRFWPTFTSPEQNLTREAFSSSNYPGGQSP